MHMFQRRGTFSVVVSSFWWDEEYKQSNRNIVLYQPGESFGDLKLNAAASSPGGGSPSVSQPVKKSFK